MTHPMTTLIAATVLATPLASAQVVYENMSGGAGGIVNAVASDRGINQLIADDVVLGSSQQVGRIEWTGSYFDGDGVPAADDNFIIKIFQDDADDPGSVLSTFTAATTRMDSGFNIFGTLDVYEYSMDIDFTFMGGVKYWIEIENNNQDRDDDTWGWGSGDTIVGAAAHQKSVASSSWREITAFAGTDFRLVVPAPSSLGMLLLSGAVVSHRRRT